MIKAEHESEIKFAIDITWYVMSIANLISDLCSAIYYLTITITDIISPSFVSYGVSIVRIWGLYYNGTTLYMVLYITLQEKGKHHSSY